MVTALYCSLTSNMPADPSLNPLPTSIPKLLTPDEVALALKISKVGVYRLVEKRLIPFYRIMGSLRFAEKDVMELMQRGLTGSAGLK